MKVLYNRKYYKPREIARLGLITNSKGSDKEDSNYAFVLNLIKTGRLKAKDYSSKPDTHYWLVPEDEIVRYHNTVN